MCDSISVMVLIKFVLCKFMIIRLKSIIKIKIKINKKIQTSENTLQSIYTTVFTQKLMHQSIPQVELTDG